ncbi:MAG: hypothetical protein QXS74_07420 [Nitrososphaeria archaeon]
MSNNEDKLIELFERTRVSRIFISEATLEIEGVVFKLRHMTLKEELDWMNQRDRVLNDNSKTRGEDS